MPGSDTLATMPDGYGELLTDLKQLITQERLRIVMSANTAMILLYWDIGQVILQRSNSHYDIQCKLRIAGCRAGKKTQRSA